MPSDPRIPQALDALSDPIEAFRSTLANTSEQIRLLISTRVDQNGSSVDEAQAELGEFASGRIDPARMAKLLAQVEPPTIEHGDVVRRALEVCDELLARREELFRVTVGDGEDLRSAVARALAEIGKAFAATRIVELVAQNQYSEALHAGLLDGHPFEHWSRAERKVELALVVCVAGRDLRVGGLADFLDRAIKLVFVVDGEAPPAPLVRLITPRVLVIQTTDPVELASIARYDGPSAMALVSDGAALFRHDPTAGPSLAERVVITQLPDKKPRKLGATSAFQQRQDLAQLEALAAASETSTEKPAAADAQEERAAESQHDVSRSEAADAESHTDAPQADAVDKLSNWLLEHADLTGPT
jgi:hypothetical protein